MACSCDDALQIPVDDAVPLIFRTWRAGDRVALAGGNGSRKLQDWFTDRHIPGYARHQLPLLARGGQRVATLLMYLREPEAGGETIFPETGIRCGSG